jgi:uncharacterized membrane protein YfcA
MQVTATQVALLCGATFFAGAVDAIAGGGGLITVPALLAVGLPPHYALGTNKGQSCFGSFAAWMRYRHAGLVDGRTAKISFPVGVAASVSGAGLALLLRPDVLRPVVLVLLLAAAGVIGFARPRPEQTSPESAGPAAAGVIAAIALVLGLYDGFFGPGTGTFIIAAYVAFVHLPLPRASANAKVLNFASNVAALAVFAMGGKVLWAVAAPMAIANLAGGFTGAHLAVRRGAGLIRRIAILVAVALVVKVARDFYLQQHAAP